MKKQIISFALALALLFTLLSSVLPITAATDTDYIGEYRLPRAFVGTDETYGLRTGTLPCVGKPRVVVFVIDFLDDNNTDNEGNAFRYSASDIEKHFFDDSMMNKPFVKGADYTPYLGYGFYSMRDFFYRSSYGKLDITGEVFTYTTEKPRKEYFPYDHDQYPQSSVYNAGDEIVDEVIKYAERESILDWNKFDTNEDGYIDGIFFVLRNSLYGTIHSGFASAGCDYTLGGKKIGTYTFMFGAGSFFPRISTMVHEAVHMMGVGDDIYLHMGKNPYGSGAHSIMDDFPISGDLPGIYKYIFNWIEPIHINTAGKTQVTLASMSDKSQMVVIHPNADRKNLNWFVVEYITPTNNNSFLPVEPEGGLRIWRATMEPSVWELHHELFGGWHFFRVKFVYLEAIHRPYTFDWDYLWNNFEKYWNHFFYPGDSFTPFTELNSNYPLGFRDENWRRYMDEMADSGIYLENIRISDGLAHFDVTIIPCKDYIPFGNLDNFTKTRAYSDTFTDIDGAWYTDWVKRAYEYGIIGGIGNNRFDPDGNLTGAQALTIGARIHSVYKYGSEGQARIESFKRPGDNWYDMYVLYAKAEGLIGFQLDRKMDTPITRAEMVFAWSKILEPMDMTPKNTVNSLPDVFAHRLYGNAIMSFYRAGIVSGVDSEGTFNPNNNITRAEAATIFMRLVDTELRSSGRTFGAP
jgi:M6 family metalloprotease-like protein